MLQAALLGALQGASNGANKPAKEAPKAGGNATAVVEPAVARNETIAAEVGFFDKIDLCEAG
jgi:hypothetical protein